jgi:hypothetical protein
MAQRGDDLPQEIMLMRGWLGEVFTQASRGLPWPQQAGLRLVEQGLALGMFGGLLSSAYLLQEFRARSAEPGRIPDLSGILQALQSAAIGPVPAPLGEALRLLLQAAPEAGSPLSTVQDFIGKSLLKGQPVWPPR